MAKRRLGKIVLGGCVAAAATFAAKKFLAPRLGEEWERTAGDGRTVSLSEGAVAVSGMGVALSATGNISPAILTAVSGLAGYIDDEWETRFPSVSKGFKGHISSLLRGTPTSGGVKILLIGTTALVCAPRGAKISGGALIAMTANLINLFDLRPGRALKVILAGTAPLMLCTQPKVAGAMATASATSLVCLPEDLEGTTMLGDTGANALGAVLGYGMAHLPKIPRYVALAGVCGLNVLSEKVSFTKIIEANPILNAIDQAGRRHS
ncbi:beta-carotene 15,15'-monooxygenase [Actinotignum urinale]|uniref:beta-carotene 15,15'-monooxygenase n=1 Tax=Actinotignum urinale TaxID=190146 RepID=UPI002A8343A5|nr:beta-carotene 15,15'-monooxygenase [Actinotignum urinale]MDY5128916.1 beta-carotene 15,15'-monooxygenase [Actinotignum urinale]